MSRVPMDLDFWLPAFASCIGCGLTFGGLWCYRRANVHEGVDDHETARLWRRGGFVMVLIGGAYTWLVSSWLSCMS
jgi:hypothetical protein